VPNVVGDVLELGAAGTRKRDVGSAQTVGTRGSIARGRLWQAEYMMSGMRDHVIALACIRHDVPAHQGRGIDDLPPRVTGPLKETFVRPLDATELRRAFMIITEALQREIGYVDAELARRMATPLATLAS